MADFASAHKIVMVHEGGYANDANDAGGETYAGISRVNFPAWIGWNIVDQVKKLGYSGQALNTALGNSVSLQNDVLAFYKANIWDALDLDQVTYQQTAVELYDTGTNMGIGTAGKFLQRALNASEDAGLTVDGNIGPKTVQALNNSTQPDNVLKVLNCLQGNRYIEIIEKNPTQKKFFKSWFSRVSL